MYLPKFLSPLNRSNMNTPICIRPSRAGKDSTFLTAQYDSSKMYKGDKKITQAVLLNSSQGKDSRTHIGQILHHSSGKVLEPRYPAHHCSSARKTKISTNRKIHH